MLLVHFAQPFRQFMHELIFKLWYSNNICRICAWIQPLVRWLYDCFLWSRKSLAEYWVKFLWEGRKQGFLLLLLLYLRFFYLHSNLGNDWSKGWFLNWTTRLYFWKWPYKIPDNIILFSFTDAVLDWTGFTICYVKGNFTFRICNVTYKWKDFTWGNRCRSGKPVLQPRNQVCGNLKD